MINPNARGAALARAAEAMLRALGGTEVKFRCPAAAAKDENARQLGLDAPVTEDIAIAPGVVRTTGESIELLIAPSSISQYVQDRAQTVEQFLDAVLAVFVDGREYALTSFRTEQSGGAEYLYRVTAKTKS